VDCGFRDLAQVLMDLPTISTLDRFGVLGQFRIHTRAIKMDVVVLAIPGTL